MSQQMRNGYGFDFPVPAGQSMLVSSITGTYTATIVAGPGKGTALATDSTGGGTYGPYSGGVVIRLQAGANSLIDYDIAVSPVLTYAGPLNAGYNSSGDVASAVDGGGNSIVLQNVISRNYTGITHTGTTANTKIFSFSIPAGSILAPSMLKFAMSIRYSTTATAGSRVIRGYLNTADAIGGTSMFSNVMSTTGVIQTSVRNNDAILFQAAAIQRGMPVAAGWNTIQGDDSSYTTYDITTQDLFFVLGAQLADASDSVSIRAFDATLIRG